jgi:hypothetical protein
MGCDIHIITEIRKNDKWEMIKEVPEYLDCRNYYAFGVLADVRNSYGVDVFRPNGLPDDLSTKKRDFHSEMESIKNFYERNIETFYEKDGVEYNILNKPEDAKKIEIPSKEKHTLKEFCNLYYKDEYDEEMDDYGYWEVNFDYDYHNYSHRTLRELLDYKKNVKKYSDIYVSEAFLDKFYELGGVLPDEMSFEKEDGKVYIEVEDEYELGGRETLFRGIDELEEIAKKYNVLPEDIRIVFAFDS